MLVLIKPGKSTLKSLMLFALVDNLLFLTYSKRQIYLNQKHFGDDPIKFSLSLIEADICIIRKQNLILVKLSGNVRERGI